MKLINVSQLAEMLNVSEKTIYDWKHKGKIPGYKLWGCLRFKPDEIEKWLKTKKIVSRTRI